MNARAPRPGGAANAGAGRLTQLTYHRVREMLLSGRLAPGSVLTEGRLAGELGVSKTPIRHALRALHQEGLLTAGPRRQMRVRAFSAAQRFELDQVRIALERLTVRAACRSMSNDDLDELHTNLRRQRRAVVEGREDDFIRLDEELHLLIAQRSGLTFAPDLLGRVRGLVSLLQITIGQEAGDLTPALEEHRAIVDALENRDVASALAALERHLGRVGARVHARRPEEERKEEGEGEREEEGQVEPESGD
ncbi:MAG: GntR family transcriptional regulator [Candidatus Dormiibacterota bacterium]